jgi:hypothetical protein
MDARKFALLEALKVAARDRAEVRLYRRGQLPGLFAQRTRSNAEIAKWAIADELLEITRVETLGKTSIEWVKLTQKGYDFLLNTARWRNCARHSPSTSKRCQSGLPR